MWSNSDNVLVNLVSFSNLHETLDNFMLLARVFVMFLLVMNMKLNVEIGANFFSVHLPNVETKD